MSVHLAITKTISLIPWAKVTLLLHSNYFASLWDGCDVSHLLHTLCLATCIDTDCIQISLWCGELMSSDNYLVWCVNGGISSASACLPSECIVKSRPSFLLTTCHFVWLQTHEGGMTLCRTLVQLSFPIKYAGWINWTCWEPDLVRMLLWVSQNTAFKALGRVSGR